MLPKTRVSDPNKTKVYAEPFSLYMSDFASSLPVGLIFDYVFLKGCENKRHDHTAQQLKKKNTAETIRAEFSGDIAVISGVVQVIVLPV